MPSIVTFARFGSVVLIGGFFAVVFWKLLTGGITLGGLLEGDIRDTNSALEYSSYVSAGRVQSLLITLFSSLFYLLQVIHHPDAFPSVPTGILGALAGSHALYLLGKAQALYVGRLKDI